MAMSDELNNGPSHFKTKQKKSFKDTFIPNKNDSSKDRMWKYITIGCNLVLVACLVIIGIWLTQLFQAKKLNTDIHDLYKSLSAAQNNAVTTAPVVTEVGETLPPVKERDPLVISDAAEEMLALNPDYAGFIYIPDVVNEPIVMTDDNDYYLKHDFYDRSRSCGTVYADYRNVLNDYDDYQSKNIILYGHNQRDGTMFGKLDYYKWDPKYWLQNPVIYLDNQYQGYGYVIISSFVTNAVPEHDDGNLFDYFNYINFTERFPFEEFKEEISARSSFSTGIDFDETDNYLTLSTCSYEWDDARHVIVARRFRAGETLENLDTTMFSVNSNPKYPAIYYKYNGGSYTE